MLFDGLAFERCDSMSSYTTLHQQSAIQANNITSYQSVTTIFTGHGKSQSETKLSQQAYPPHPLHKQEGPLPLLLPISKHPQTSKQP